MRYCEILENIQKLTTENYPKSYRINFEKSGENHYGTDKLEIVLIDARFSEEVVYKKTFQAINEEIKAIGKGKYFNAMKILLGKYVRKIFSRGDIFWGSNDSARGCEQKGHRPYIIVSNNMNNNHSKLLTVVPVTTKEKGNLPTHKTIYINKTKSTAVCEQITTIEKIDLLKYIKSLTLDEFREIEEGIMVQLALNKSTKEEVVEQKKKKRNWLVEMFVKIKKIFKKRKKR